MEQAIGVAVFLVGLLISIGLHEVGHMVPAKKFGVRVSEYFVGFGPTVWSRRGKETEYGLKAIPLGGYVKLVGMVPPAEAVKPVRGTGRIARLIADAREASVEEIREGEDHRAFYHLAWWKKIIVMAGGPLVNLVLAALFFTVVLVGIGAPTSVPTAAQVYPCVPAAGASDCTASDPASPASQAGMQAGDRIVSIDGEPVETWSDVTTVVADSAGVELAFVVDRAGETVELTLTPAAAQRPVYDANGQAVLDGNGEQVTAEIGYMGVSPETEIQRRGIGSGVALTGDYLTATFKVVANLPNQLYHVSRAALGLETRSTSSIMGIVGVGRIAGDVAAADIEGYGIPQKIGDMLMLLGGLNLALFVFNMIPLVPLDGGHIASAIWQAIKNGWARVRGLATPRPVDVARMMPLAYGVFGILLVMGLVLIYADIVAPVAIG